MKFEPDMKALKTILLLLVLLVMAAAAGLHVGYRRGYHHGETITNKWWIDQQSQYYDASEVEKKRRALYHDTI